MLSICNISKLYPGVRALDDVNFTVSSGEVLALIGENGAGKSTLMKVLGGVISPTSGHIEIDGDQFDRLTIHQSMDLGIAFVHQELNLFDNLDVAANIFIGREPRIGRTSLIDTRKMCRDAGELLGRLGIDINPKEPLSNLPIAKKQMVEICKALSLDAKIIIMDEPTSSLTLSETEALLKTVSNLREQGVTIIYISHRLNEIITCADRVVGLRDGAYVGELQKGEITHDNMVKLMVGREIVPEITSHDFSDKPVIYEARAIRSDLFPEIETSFAVRAGEILGFAGLIGSGRTELMEAIFGIHGPTNGVSVLNGDPVQVTSARSAIVAGIYLIPEDRKECGIILDLPIRENISLPNLAALSRGRMVNKGREEQISEDGRQALRIKCASTAVDVGTLSGGNQQKVVLAKWLAMDPHLIIFDEPTRGIDIGAKEEIYTLMRELADRGVAVVMVSSDMEEVMMVSDRIAVMHEGRVTGYLQHDQVTEDAIMHLAVGGAVTPNAA